MTIWKKKSQKLMPVNDYLELIEKDFELPNGKTKKSFIKKETSFVCGLPITKDNEVICCYEYRPGPERLFIDIPSGAINEDDNELPEEAMRRELLEETGYEGEVEFLNSSWVNPYSTSIRHSFLIKNCMKTSKQNLDPDEFIEVVKLPLKDFVSHVNSGKVINIGTIYYAFNKLKDLKLI